MSFGSLSYLWSFALILPLVLVYLLKVKPVQKFTTVLFLWEEILDQKKANKLFEKLKDLFSLLFLLAAFLFFCTALLDPAFVLEEDRKDLLLLIDNSLSMSALEEDGTYLSKAKKEGLEIIKGMGLNRHAVLASVSSQIEYLVDKTNNLKVLSEGLTRVDESEHGLNLKLFDEMAMNEGLLSNYRLIFITDGNHNEMAKYDFLEIVKVGKDVSNVGIVGFDIQRMPAGQNAAGIFLNLYNDNSHDQEVDIHIYADSIENLFKVVSVNLVKNTNTIFVDTFENMPAGKWIAKIKNEDALPQDNISYAFLPAYVPIRIKIESQNSIFFLQKCVEAFNGIKNSFTLVQNEPDVIITDSQELALSSKKPVVLFGVTSTSIYWEMENEEKTDAKLVSIGAENHRAIKYLKPDLFKLYGSKKLKPSKGTLAILEDEKKNPLLMKIIGSAQKLYVLNFDLHESDFFLNVNFPILMHNLCLDLTQRDDDIVVSYQVGDYIYLPEYTGISKLLSPNGKEMQFSEKHIGPLLEKGFHQIDLRSELKTLAVGSSPEAESKLDSSAVKTTLKPISSGLPPAYYLLFFAIFLVLLELILYHRRKVG